MITSIKEFASEVITMSSKTRIAQLGSHIDLTITFLFLFLLFGAVLATPGTADAEERVSTSQHIVKGGRDNPTQTLETREEYGALVTIGEREKTQTRGGFSKFGADSVQSQSGSFDFWFYEVDVVLLDDDDRDGFHTGIDLLFDVDTNFTSADIYAVMYLSFEGGPWNEYAATEDFTIFGTSGDDEYVVVTELDSGYPTGNYDLLIEIFDAWDGAYLASFGPEDTSELAYLPLEDYNRDAPVVVIERRTTVTRGGGGSADGWLLTGFLAILFGSAFRRIWRRRNDQLVRIDSPAPCWQNHAKRPPRS